MYWVIKQTQMEPYHLSIMLDTSLKKIKKEYYTLYCSFILSLSSLNKKMHE
jgi:hypothetical protein